MRRSSSATGRQRIPGECARSSSLKERCSAACCQAVTRPRPRRSWRSKRGEASALFAQLSNLREVDSDAFDLLRPVLVECYLFNPSLQRAIEELDVPPVSEKTGCIAKRGSATSANEGKPLGVDLLCALCSERKPAVIVSSTLQRQTNALRPQSMTRVAESLELLAQGDRWRKVVVYPTRTDAHCVGRPVDADGIAVYQKAVGNLTAQLPLGLFGIAPVEAAGELPKTESVNAVLTVFEEFVRAKEEEVQPASGPAGSSPFGKKAEAVVFNQRLMTCVA